MRNPEAPYSDSYYESYEKPIYVILSCNGTYTNESEVKFLNIEEDIHGRDLLTFLCPLCEEQHTSLRLG